MLHQSLMTSNDIRAKFSAAMSKMYREEVPAYGALMDLVADVNGQKLASDPALTSELMATDGIERLSEERHGAIRLGTAVELNLMRRVFAIMGMFPVSYYDLSVAGIPVHSTAFRPVSKEALAQNPFRVFTSLLRLDLIEDAQLRLDALSVLETRQIFTPGAITLVEKADAAGGLDAADAGVFIHEILETFRWHPKARVDKAFYDRLHDAHRLIADVVSFKGPHINHLTPRTLDIDAVQRLMPEVGITPKAVVEGPPRRNCPILLRQTSFKALEENIEFASGTGEPVQGQHTARFGEIEQRGIALTPKGRKLYDDLLDQTRAAAAPKADGSNTKDYGDVLRQVFRDFPDDWTALRDQNLGYFLYSLNDLAPTHQGSSDEGNMEMDELIALGLVRFDPIIYEDFLPVSAAGIFQSNLGDHAAQSITQNSNQDQFETALGATVLDEFAHYAEIEKVSIATVFDALRSPSASK